MRARRHPTCCWNDIRGQMLNLPLTVIYTVREDKNEVQTFLFFFCCDTGKIASFWWSCAVAMQIYDVTRWPRRPHPVIQPDRHLRLAANRAQRKSPNDTVRPDSLPFPPRETDVQPKAEKQLQLQLRLVRLHSTQGFRHDVCFNISLWSKYRSLSAIAAE